MTTDKEIVLGKIMNILLAAGAPIHKQYVSYMADYILTLGFEPDSVVVGFEKGNVVIQGTPKEGFTPVFSEEPIDLREAVKDSLSKPPQPEELDIEKVLKDIFGEENIKIIHADSMEEMEEDEDSPLSIVSSEFTDEECVLEVNTLKHIFKLFKETYEERIATDSVDRLYELNGDTIIIINGIDSLPKALGFFLAMFENCHYEKFQITYAQVISWAVKFTNLSNEGLEVRIPLEFIGIFERSLN